SGNFLNWAATPTIDPFRWAMTGGRRVIDTASETILEKAWHAGQGLFPNRSIPAGEIAGATPFDTASALTISVENRGFAMQTTSSGGALRAEYFNNTTLSNPAVLTVPNDSGNHNWGNASPGTGVNADLFSARFSGSYIAPSTGTYTFRVRGDDGVRLYVNGNLLIDKWVDQGPTNYDANVALTAGQTFDVRVEYYDNTGGAVMELSWMPPGGQFVTFTDSIGAQTSNTYTMRNKVCVPGLLEANCKQYGSNWKPEGLMQEYAQRMRFSVFGYLNEDGNDRDGGVMRARQKFVGPTKPVPGLPEVDNLGKEWSATDGTFFPNPDSGDATASSGSGVTISDSGAINYLNKFGQLLPGNYKGNDPVGEMYYAALRYYRNLGNVPEWSNLTTTNAARAKQLDGFPVITTWDDPIEFSCQRNFILGIGDIYTHGDKNLPGNTNTSNEPTLPTLVRNDTTVNSVLITNKLGQLQGMGDDLGTRTNVSAGCCSDNSARMAGLAYDANTKDIRLDDATKPNTIGRQTVQTYWVDVLERAFQVNNQFYLASKYGGLKLPKSIEDTFDPLTFSGTIEQSWWSTNGEMLTEGGTSQPRPDNYFTAGRPDTMVDGLTKAFASIANAIKSFTTSFSLSTSQVSESGAASYATQYDSDGWSGTLTGSLMTFVNGVPALVEKWSTATTLVTQFASGGWNTNRRVVTWNGTAGVAFRSGTITADQLAALDTPWATGNDSVNYLNYLRGDRAYERTTTDETKPYRRRQTLLGDIANAKVTPVGPPSARYSNTVNPGYATFKTDNAARKNMVFVGANDGMLHAFDGSLTGTGAGTELFAYVPSPLFAGPTGTPTVNGLAQLGNPNYEHRYYVDATPRAFDLDMNFAGGVFTTTASGGSAWRTLLVGGLGKGGRAFYAIDVTDPTTMTTEDEVKAKIKWEFSNATTGVGGTLGYSYGAPLVVKTKKYGWVVVLSSGYTESATAGNGYIYFVHPNTGALLEKVSTGATSAGLTQMTAYITDYTDGTADAIYAGDLNGQLWRFDVTAARGSVDPYPAPLKLATLSDASGNAQPITTAPLVEVDPTTKQRYVMVGTGQLLDTADIKSPAAQTFYAIIDGTASLFGSGGTYPITRAQLESLSDEELVGTTPIDFTSDQGWYIELGSTSNVGWRSVTSATAFNGVVAFSTLLTTGNACSPSGQSRVYAVKFGAGRTALVPATTPFVSYDHAITDLKFLSDRGTVRGVAGDVEGKQHVPPIDLGGGNSLRLLNWREVPAVD
ncbi:MAG: pilus assembly protein, partial [Alcaligenaceae bacterium]